VTIYIILYYIIKKTRQVENSTSGIRDWNNEEDNVKIGRMLDNKAQQVFPSSKKIEILWVKIVMLATLYFE